MTESTLTPAYLGNLDCLHEDFPAAAHFMRQLPRSQRLWLSTAKNAHLYRERDFLAYIKFVRTGGKSGVLISPKRNAHIATGTSDRASEFFAQLDQLTANYSDPWITVQVDRGVDAWLFSPPAHTDAASELFEDLLHLLIHEELPPLGPVDVEAECRAFIRSHGLGSNDLRGFSCFIPDRGHRNEGIVLWVFSKTYERIETQFQKLHSRARIHRVTQMLGITEVEYAEEMTRAATIYTERLMDTGFFKMIGGGVRLFNNSLVKNLACDVERLREEPAALQQLFEVTRDSSLVDWAESHGYFRLND